MSKLLLDTFKFLSKGARKIALINYLNTNDLRNNNNFFFMFLSGIFSKNRGSHLMSEREQFKNFSSFNKGILLDGTSKRLNEQDSFKHFLVTGKSGSGKTTGFIFPNIFKLAEEKKSIIVNDPSGEIFQKTSGYMQSKGYKVMKFDPLDMERTLYFNPFRFVFDHFGGSREVNHIKVKLFIIGLVNSTMNGKKDFWYSGAENLLEFLALCLLNAPAEYHNLYNLYKLTEAVTPTGVLLIDFMAKYGNTPDLRSKWKSLIENGNETFQGFIVTAQTLMGKIYNQRTIRLLSKNSIRFTDLRKEKTIIYLTFPERHLEFYGFIPDIFYTLLFDSLMDRLPEKSDLSVYFLFDEFGHSKIPNFPQILTSIRKYDVCICIMVQSISQLRERYGMDGADTILEGGIESKLFLSGSSAKTAEEAERLTGKVIRDEVYTTREKERTDRKQYNLLNADEIRTIKQDEALFITGNKQPVLLKVKPYYKNFKYKRKVNFGEAYLKKYNLNFDLKNILEDIKNR